MRKKIDTKQIPVCWHVITVSTITVSEFRTNIEFKIPSYFKECYGIAFGSTTDGKAAASFILGHLTLHANSKKTNPVQLPVQVVPFATQRRKYDVIRLKETMIGGMRVQAEYKDNNTLATVPNPAPTYSLKIYLKGERRKTDA